MRGLTGWPLRDTAGDICGLLSFRGVTMVLLLLDVEGGCADRWGDSVRCELADAVVSVVERPALRVSLVVVLPIEGEALVDAMDDWLGCVGGRAGREAGSGLLPSGAGVVASAVRGVVVVESAPPDVCLGRREEPSLFFARRLLSACRLLLATRSLWQGIQYMPWLVFAKTSSSMRLLQERQVKHDAWYDSSPVCAASEGVFALCGCDREHGEHGVDCGIAGVNGSQHMVNSRQA